MFYIFNCQHAIFIIKSNTPITSNQKKFQKSLRNFFQELLSKNDIRINFRFEEITEFHMKT